MNRKIEHIIVDAAGFLKNVQIQDLAENVYTIQEVVSEIRDSATRQRLAVLPYDINFKSPSGDSITHVSDFAKKTGDWGSLSATDIKVMALTYQITKEKVGTEHLKKVPEKKMTLTCSKKPLLKATDIEGFYYPEKRKTEKVEDNNVESNIDSEPNKQSIETLTENSEEQINQINGINKQDNIEIDELTEVPELELIGEGDSINDGENIEKQAEDIINSDVEVEDQGNEDIVNEGEKLDNGDEDDDVGWITPSNIKEIKGWDRDQTDLSGVKVGCLTTDFAMQNVLIQMGVSVVSVDGMLIRKAKSYALRCHSCFKITSNTQKVFCPKCGNKTLTKVTVTVDEDGTQRYHLSSRRAINTRGLKYPLPLPKGGKHSANPVLVEDQPMPQNRPAKKTLSKMNAFDPDYVARGSPFSINDVTSRAAQLGIHGSVGNSSRRRNPNEVKHKKGRKK